MEIQCPTGGMHVLVTNGTICVRGIVTDEDATGGTLGGIVVRVRVLPGQQPPPPLEPADPKQPGDVDTSPIGQQWCARNVPVPGPNPAGDPLTVVVWSRAAAHLPWSAAQSEWFFGGGPGPVDCCVGCVG